MKIITLVVAIVFGGVGLAVAGDSPSTLDIARHIFDHADGDKDGTLSRVEHDRAKLDRYGVPFREFDLDRDSRVTWEEYKMIIQRHHPSSDDREV